MPPTFSSDPQLLTLKGRFWMTELSNNSPFCDAFSGPPTSQAGGGIWTKGTGSQKKKSQSWELSTVLSRFPPSGRLVLQIFLHKWEFQIQNWLLKVPETKIPLNWWDLEEKGAPPPPPPAPFPLIWYALVPTGVCIDPRPLRPARPSSAAVRWDRPSQNHSTTTPAWTPLQPSTLWNSIHFNRHSLNPGSRSCPLHW